MVHATLVPILIFGFVDIMYLATEVAYRNLYTRVVQSIRDGAYTKSMVLRSAGPAGRGLRHLGDRLVVHRSLYPAHAKSENPWTR